MLRCSPNGRSVGRVLPSTFNDLVHRCLQLSSAGLSASCSCLTTLQPRHNFGCALQVRRDASDRRRHCCYYPDRCRRRFLAHPRVLRCRHRPRCTIGITSCAQPPPISSTAPSMTSSRRSTKSYMRGPPFAGLALRGGRMRQWHTMENPRASYDQRTHRKFLLVG